MNLTKEDFLALNKIYNDAIEMATYYFKLLHYRELYDETPDITIKYIDENEIKFVANFIGKWDVKSISTFVLEADFFTNEDFFEKIMSPLIYEKEKYDEYLAKKVELIKEQEYKHYLELKEKFENE